MAGSVGTRRVGWVKTRPKLTDAHRTAKTPKNPRTRGLTTKAQRTQVPKEDSQQKPIRIHFLSLFLRTFRFLWFPDLLCVLCAFVVNDPLPVFLPTTWRYMGSGSSLARPVFVQRVD